MYYIIKFYDILLDDWKIYGLSYKSLERMKYILEDLRKIYPELQFKICKITEEDLDD